MEKPLSEYKGLIEEYTKRISRFADCEVLVVSEASLPKQLSALDYVITLDEHGKEYTSKEFSQKIQNLENRSIKRIGFVIGNAHSVPEIAQKQAAEQLSLSRLTFPHQMVPVLFLEQLYRAYTIINNMPYHHE